MRDHQICTGIVLSLSILLSCGSAVAQEDETLFLRFELMKVADDQENAWQEVVDFFVPIMQRRVNSGEILGADLFSLQPGGMNQGYQYLSVTTFNDPVTMMEEDVDVMAHAQAAHPDMATEAIQAMFGQLREARDTGSIYYLERIAATDSGFQMQPGIVIELDLMKVPTFGAGDYEQAEVEIFQPVHQQHIDNGSMGDWQLLRLIYPFGSNASASHITVNMYTGYDQLFSRIPFDEFIENQPQSQQQLYRIGMETRDHVWTYLAKLERVVR